jgi:hypothetical protein
MNKKARHHDLEQEYLRVLQPGMYLPPLPPPKPSILKSVSVFVLLDA